MDANTFQAHVSHLEKLMYHVSYSILRNNEDCADAVQEALACAWQRRESLRSMDRFRPWLMRILVNLCNDMLKARQKRMYFPLEETILTVTTPESPVPLGEALHALKPEWQLVIVLHYLEGYSIRDIADMLGLPSNTVKSRMRLARDRLRILLKEEWEESPCTI